MATKTQASLIARIWGSISSGIKNAGSWILSGIINGIKALGRGLLVLPELIYLGFRGLIIYILRFVNIFLNLQWNPKLNLHQNLLMCIYVPDSEGRLSMHTTLVCGVFALLSMTLLLEMYRFVTIKEFQFSVGFYATLAVFSSIVKMAYSRDRHFKLKNGFVKPAVSVVPGKDGKPAPVTVSTAFAESKKDEKKDDKKPAEDSTIVKILKKIQGWITDYLKSKTG